MSQDYIRVVHPNNPNIIGYMKYYVYLDYTAKSFNEFAFRLSCDCIVNTSNNSILKMRDCIENFCNVRFGIE